MKLAAAIAVAALAGAVQPAAAADGTFDMFQKLCVATGARQIDALAAADAMGWQPIEPTLLNAIMKSNPVGGETSQKDGRMAPASAGRAALVVSHIAYSKAADRIAGDICVLAAPDADMAALKADTARFAAMPAAMSQKDDVMYVWKDEGGSRRPISPAQANKLNSNAGLTMLAVGRAPSGAIVLLLAPTK